MISAFIAAAFTFTASATGVAKGTPVEFLFVSRDSDRDYEAMFFLDMPMADFAAALDKVGFPRGKPLDPLKCNVWPVGPVVGLEPPMSKFVSTNSEQGFSAPQLIYTGGKLKNDGSLEASSEMPGAACALYTLPQALIVPDGIHNQGDVYGRFVAADTLKKGTRYAFTISCDPTSAPRPFSYRITPGGAEALLRKLREDSSKGPIEARVTFDGELQVSEAVAAASALNVIDSMTVRLNGCDDGTLFYRAFIPLVKWNDRQNRMVQPFELTLSGESDKLVFINEDWNVPGDDPKLTPEMISFEEARKKENVDTAFIYVSPDARLSRVYAAMKKLEGSKVSNWYVFATNCPSLHNPPYARKREEHHESHN